VDIGDIEHFARADYGRVVAVVAVLCDRRTDVAEELVQEALATAWQRDIDVESLAAWVTVAASNRARSRRRRRSREEVAYAQIARSRRSESVQSAERLDVRDALAGLPARERQAAALYYLLDQPVTAVAAVMGVSDGTVKTLLSRARTHLAAHLAEEVDR
jgi:RNA polymerase sigma-70 factor, ECF subfamily